MPRPFKYETIEEAAQHNLFNKIGGPKLGLPIEEFMDLITQRCDVCGCEPGEIIVYERADGKHVIKYQYGRQIDATGTLKPVCRTCLWLLTNFDLKEVLTTCARIMARRMHGKINQWLFRAVG
jgi:hypothetical protein